MKDLPILFFEDLLINIMYSMIVSTADLYNIRHHF